MCRCVCCFFPHECFLPSYKCSLLTSLNQGLKMNFSTGAMLFCYFAEYYCQKVAYFSNIFYGLLLQGPKVNGRLTNLPVGNENWGHLSVIQWYNVRAKFCQHCPSSEFKKDSHLQTAWCFNGLILFSLKCVGHCDIHLGIVIFCQRRQFGGRSDTATLFRYQLHFTSLQSTKTLEISYLSSAAQLPNALFVVSVLHLMQTCKLVSGMWNTTRFLKHIFKNMFSVLNIKLSFVRRETVWTPSLENINCDLQLIM
jgi:hypothetical protein